MDRDHDLEQDEDLPLPPSKSQRKRDMHALQDLGRQLVELPAAALKRIELPDRLREAVDLARSIKAHGGRKRQLQYIGKLMREIDAEPIRAALEHRTHQAREDAHRFHRLEELRDRLLAEGDDAVEAVCEQFPGVERQRLRQLVRQAIKEKEQEKPPKSARQLFRYLRELAEM